MVRLRLTNLQELGHQSGFALGAWLPKPSLTAWMARKTPIESAVWSWAYLSQWLVRRRLHTEHDLIAGTGANFNLNWLYEISFHGGEPIACLGCWR